jgi:hypothetical protein
MVQPVPPADGVSAYGPPYTTSAGAEGWAPAPAPSWTPGWPPPGQAPAPVAGRPPGARGPLALAGVALAGVLAGAVGAGFLVTAVFVGSAADIGREIGAELGPEIGQATAEGLTQGMDEAVGSFEEEFASGGSGAGLGPVEKFPPVAPGDLGPDPVLDEYAASCFDGSMQSCDDLLYESPPLSEYERYALSCGGRVEQYAVAACTDLDQGPVRRQGCAGAGPREVEVGNAGP